MVEPALPLAKMPTWIKAVSLTGLCLAVPLLAGALWAALIDNEQEEARVMAQTAFGITLAVVVVVLGERRWRRLALGECRGRTEEEEGDRSELDAALAKMGKSVEARKRRVAAAKADDEVPF